MRVPSLRAARMRQDDNVPDDNKSVNEDAQASFPIDAPLDEAADGSLNAKDSPQAQSPEVNIDDYAEEAHERAEQQELASAMDDSDVDPDAVSDDGESEQENDSQSSDADAAHESGEVPQPTGEDEGAHHESVPGSDGEADADAPASAEGEPVVAPKPKSRTRAKPRPTRTVQLVVNDEPGDECRIAILADGRLDSYFSEREATATNVGSIYKGRVMNIEGAIQAAFIDFGSGQNGFLHISDLHPKYFPGEERTEQVGKKIARSERPLIQQALRKGQEILVQVIKEGLGSKGPTLTSYLSLPGRLLVMMPDMDRVGVSRRVEDEDQRREMRRILDSLELPEGFGFILRTAGFDSTKTELQRDAAYLQRLWDAMEKRSSKTGAPCELYTESDVLIRTLRDQVDSTVESIVVDSPGAFERAKMFLDVIAPKSSGTVQYYNGKVPVFEAFGIERQIDEIHSRVVPLPSGGALVFDQTEALVAIDVNSGRSRSARDSETNAFQTNCEAIEEVCRQLRLRDLGGLIVVDCIDMRFIKHRREVEERLTALLKIDRAKSSFAPISEFGIIEMTRQRMRPSLRKMHYADCTHCTGSGEIRVSGAVAADAMRRIALLFSYTNVHRVELVCSVRVAGELLSNRRRAMHELEERASKRIDVRISEAFAADRIEYYAYDEQNSDLELDRLPAAPRPGKGALHDELPEEEVVELSPAEVLARRRRRKRKPAPADATAIALAGGFEDLPDVSDEELSVRETLAQRTASEEPSQQDHGQRSGGRDGRRRRGGRGGEQSARGSGERNAQSGSSGSSGSRGENQPRSGQGNANASSERSPRGQSANRRRRGRGRRGIDSIIDMVGEKAAFETTRVANILQTSVEDLISKLRADVDPEVAALLTPATTMLPPELIARAQTLYPEASAQSDDSDTAQSQEGGNDDGASDPMPQAKQASQGEPRRQQNRTGQESAKGNDQERGGRSRRGGRRGRGGRGRDANDRGGSQSSQAAQSSQDDSASASDSSAPREPSQPRREQRSDTPRPAQESQSTPSPAAASAAPSAESKTPAKPKRRSLYGAAVRLLSSLERSKAKGRPE